MNSKNHKVKDDNRENNESSTDLKDDKEGSNQDKVEENQSQDESITHEEETAKLREEKLRLLADMENLRKRVEREKLQSIKFGNINLARDILSTSDNLTRALKNIPNNENLTEPMKNLVNGLKMVQKEFNTILERHGVKKINALNKKFDHNLHQAMLEIETNKENGIVVQEIQSGYTLHDRLLRPAMVGVSKKTTKNKKKKQIN